MHVRERRMVSCSCVEGRPTCWLTYLSQCTASAAPTSTMSWPIALNAGPSSGRSSDHTLGRQ